MSKEKTITKVAVNISKQAAGLSFIIAFSIVIISISLAMQPANILSPRKAMALGLVNLKPKGAGLGLYKSPDTSWQAPDISTVPSGKAGDRIRYGKELLSNTAKYFGPRGSVARISNGMNCQNCHLEGGSRLFANNFAGFIANYPKYSERSGKTESTSERIAECFERSLNGKVPDTSGKEVQSMLAYMKWIGKDVKKGEKPYGSGIKKLALIDHAADPIKGKTVYMMNCRGCHGANGEGRLALDKRSYVYPPLWGKHSYNDGAGMYRLTNFAGFVKNNMPFGVTYQKPLLSDDDAWNVAAFVNSQPRPHKEQHNDWKNLKKKPIDFPFGPYADKFTERQHKYGPFNMLVKIK